MILLDVFSDKIASPTLSFEGGWVNNPADKGGETYRGISRKANPKWSGWGAVDIYPNKTKNLIIAQLEADVKLYYYNNYFKIYNLHLLNNVNVAFSIFDFVVNSGMHNAQNPMLTAVNTAFGTSLKSFNVDAINTLNTLDSAKLLLAIAVAREGYLAKVLASNPSQEVFRAGWNNRLAKVRALVGLPARTEIGQSAPSTTNNYLPYILVALVVGAMLFYFMNKSKKEEESIA